jgi:hypothetical protein
VRLTAISNSSGDKPDCSVGIVIGRRHLVRPLRRARAGRLLYRNRDRLRAVPALFFGLSRAIRGLLEARSHCGGCGRLARRLAAV